MPRNNLLRFAIIAGLLLMFGLLASRLPGNIPDLGGNPETAQAHAFRNPAKSIAEVTLAVFYVVPKNKKVHPEWQGVVEDILAQAKQFHRLQFRGKSVITYHIFPRPLVLEKHNLIYDTDKTDYGNPRGLIAIGQEVYRRAFRPGGDSYDPDFAGWEKKQYPVLGLVYEGVGAAGGIIQEGGAKSAFEIARELGIDESVVFPVDIDFFQGFFLLNREFLTHAEYKAFAPALLYHEFAHTLGFPDEYDKETGEARTNGILGGGRRDPLETNHIEKAALKDAGVF